MTWHLPCVQVDRPQGRIFAYVESVRKSFFSRLSNTRWLEKVFRFMMSAVLLLGLCTRSEEAQMQCGLAGRISRCDALHWNTSALMTIIRGS